MKQKAKLDSVFTYMGKDGTVNYCLKLDNGDILVRKDNKILMMIKKKDVIEYIALSRSSAPDYQFWLHQNVIISINGRSAREIQSEMPDYI